MKIGESKNGFTRTEKGYVYRFYVDGKRYSVSGDTEKICRERAKEKEQKLLSGMKKSADVITWAEYCEEWLKYKAITAKESTIHGYKKKLKMLSDLDDKRMQSLDRRDILELQSKLAKKYASSTTNWLISKVKEICESAVADKIIPSNPVVRIQPLQRTEPKATDTIHRALSKDEQTRFFSYAKSKNAWYTELFEFMLVTGVRVGEAGGLKWCDIDDKYIHVHDTVAEVGDNIYKLQRAKTSAAIRDLPLTDSAREILARQKLKLARYKGIAFTAPNRSVFVSFKNGVFINPSMVDSAIELICDKIHMDRISSHAFRDTYATRCILQGMQPNTLKKLMGHTKIAITMDLYAQVKPEDMAEAMSKINIL